MPRHFTLEQRMDRLGALHETNEPRRKSPRNAQAADIEEGVDHRTQQIRGADGIGRRLAVGGIGAADGLAHPEAAAAERQGGELRPVVAAPLALILGVRP